MSSPGTASALRRGFSHVGRAYSRRAHGPRQGGQHARAAGRRDLHRRPPESLPLPDDHRAGGLLVGGRLAAAYERAQPPVHEARPLSLVLPGRAKGHLQDRSDARLLRDRRDLTLSPSWRPPSTRSWPRVSATGGPCMAPWPPKPATIHRPASTSPTYGWPSPPMSTFATTWRATCRSASDGARTRASSANSSSIWE